MQSKTTDKKAIVLLSGGQDSATCLFWALKNFAEAEAVGFDYGQKHLAELDQARKIAKRAGVTFNVLDIGGLLFGSSLTDHAKNHNDAHEINADLPNSFTAGRNALFLTIAASLAHGKRIGDIVTGTCQTDFSGYPDCRRIFIESQQNTLSLALDSDVRIHTPLMYLTKAETWRLAAELSDENFDVVEIVRKVTMTDYNGDKTMNEWGMGKLDNPASQLRAKGYFEAKEKGWI